jgi:hypothetical protein
MEQVTDSACLLLGFADIALAQGLPVASEVPEPPKLAVMAETGAKKCNCKRSGCLKLYCECFAAGTFCDDCNCKTCSNTAAEVRIIICGCYAQSAAGSSFACPSASQEHAPIRKKAISAILKRNPNAFRPKSTNTHWGCHCRKTGCLKKYCECFHAGVSCTENCQCRVSATINCRTPLLTLRFCPQDCKNVSGRPGLAALPADINASTQAVPVARMPVNSMASVPDARTAGTVTDSISVSPLRTTTFNL